MITALGYITCRQIVAEQDLCILEGEIYIVLYICITVFKYTKMTSEWKGINHPKQFLLAGQEVTGLNEDKEDLS